MAKVLVTGGAGFIGSHVVDHLLEQGREVRVLDAVIEQVHGTDGPSYLSSEAELVRADIRDRAAVAAALEGVDSVVHLAAEVGVGQSMYEVKRYVDTNTSGTANLLDVLANDTHDVGKVVVASSMSIYGEGAYRCATHGDQAPGQRDEGALRRREWEVACPQCGAALEPIPTPEDKRLLPSSVYALTKMDQELLTLNVCGAYDIAATAVRYFNGYGARQALSNPYTGVAAIFSSRILNGRPPLVMEDGLQRRDFVHVKDIARATVLALTSSAADGHAVNVGGGDPISILEVAELLARALDREDIEPEVVQKYRVGDIRHCWADSTKARDLLGFVPEFSFRDKGVEDLIEWVEQQTATDRVDDAAAELSRRGLAI
ncbi:NAD-dependent epimerase/dehydratase family protein [Luteipulveratus mongoliensis]|uniref:NAD-dependent epimerase/dehydratase domain-containing protein n=1 Tax=Luteipulveratus mongoliensis TaxID=571913 RepID=A0A0K1JE84_9MICO|nr:SDR family NAD(P)-dependent oxidoreductase [Luteipulveratus mongoliensis]AKU14903.1 hypothetical protein VV02_01865 [Luteipulveratus mongoliensis]